MEFVSDLFQLGFSAENQHEPEVTSDLKTVSFDDHHDVVAEILFALVGVGHA